MSSLLAVRHGQARFFSDDYDRLSELGVTQAEKLAEFWLAQEVRPDAVWTGTLLRQQRTAEAVAKVFADSGEAWPEHQLSDGFNEYPAEEIMRALLPSLRNDSSDIENLATEFEAATNEHDRYRPLHRLLEAVIACWVRGNYDSGLLALGWDEFSAAVRDAFRLAMDDAGSGKVVAVFTSGGPIGVSVQTVMEAPQLKAAELNWRVRNCSITRYSFSGKRVSLDSFNDVAHLEAELHTYR